MSAKNMWYPKNLLITTAVLYFLATLVSSLNDIINDSKVFISIEMLFSVAAAVGVAMTGREFKSVYTGNLGRFGKAMYVMGIIMAIAAWVYAKLAKYGGDTSQSDMLIEDLNMIEVVAFAIPFCVITYLMLWPLRILAKITPTSDEPTESQFPSWPK